MLKYTLKWCLKYGNYDNVIKQKVKKGIKHVKQVVQSWYLRIYQPTKWHLKYKLGTNTIKM